MEWDKLKIFEHDQIDVKEPKDFITEKEKLIAAKQILLGLAIIYVITLLAFICRPNDGDKLIDVCTTVFPPLATLILVAYFREKG
jgi:hypothetical protein